ncbi:MAG: hypothetical protein A2Y94_02630 [Caldithrix sp. RBG_13_44_9]|nr:MAG: hypothetical protein A2Y94_02630 [Caldithrix sp. RBG_13_44_9]
MSTSSASIIIHRPVEEIFSFISDYHNDWKWRSRRIDFQKLNDTDPAEFMVTQKYFPLLNHKIHSSYQLIDYSKNEHIISQIQVGKIQVIDKRQVRSLETHLTCFEYSLDIKLSGILKIFGQLLTHRLYYHLNQDLQWLKEMLEKLAIPYSQRELPDLRPTFTTESTRLLGLT